MQYDRHDVSIERLLPASVEPPDLAAITQLHCQAFSGGIIAKLGERFVRQYYESVINSPSGRLFAAKEGDRIIGYLAGTIARDDFERTNRLGAARYRLLWRLVTFRLCPLAVLRAMRKRRLTADHAEPAELISIAISAEARRRGIGLQLLAAWTRTLEQERIGSFIVFTDNTEGYNFYRKCGAEVLFTFRLAGQESAAFRMRIAVSGR